MGNSDTAVTKITGLMEEQDRSVAWLSRATGIPYKRLLAEIKHQKRPVSLDTALLAADALGSNLPELVGVAA